jgi:hypothetical protein
MNPYGYVAKEAISVDGVLAFQPGDPVPDETVKTNGWELKGLVEKAEQGHSASNEPAMSKAADPEPASSKKAGTRGPSSGN